MNNPLPSGATLKDRTYRIQDLLKIGGQSIVYEGVEVESGQQVIIKQNYEEQEWSHEVLRQEASLLDSLEHRSLPRVHDCFSEKGSTFLVLSRIPGSDVEELLQSRKSPFLHTEVLDWAFQLLDILEYLQAQEPTIIHRDINPKNVRLTPDNQIFLLDFGIAKRINLKTFLIGGTRRFAPPEQLKDEGTDCRTDIYALAATLYYLLTAREPPDSLSRESSALKGQADPLRLACELNMEIPVPISQVLSRALSLERERRPGDAKIMRQWLSDAVKGVSLEEDVAGDSNEGSADSDITHLSVRDSVKVVVPFDVAMRGDVTPEADQLLALLNEGYDLDPGLVQILIEVLDNQLERRKEIVKRHSNLLHKNHKLRSQVAITLTEKLAADAYINPEVEKQLRQKLGRFLADHTLSEITADQKKRDAAEPENRALLLEAGAIRQHIIHRKWLRGIAIWLVRGFMMGIIAQLLLTFFTGSQTIIYLLTEGPGGAWIAHILLSVLSILLMILIRRTKGTHHLTNNEPQLEWKVGGVGFGILLAVIIFHDLLWVVGITSP